MVNIFSLIDFAEIIQYRFYFGKILVTFKRGLQNAKRKFDFISVLFMALALQIDLRLEIL